MPETNAESAQASGGEAVTLEGESEVRKGAKSVPDEGTISSVDDLIGDNIDPPPAQSSGPAPEVAAPEAPKAGRGRPPKYATEEERREAKRLSDSKRRARSALPPKNASARTAVGEQERQLQAEREAQTLKLDTAAKMSANLVFNLGVMIFGDPLGVPNAGEKEGMLLGFRSYYEARGIPNIPPEIGLAIVVIAYAAPRVKHEAMKGKMTRLKEWINARFGRKPKTESEVMQ